MRFVTRIAALIAAVVLVIGLGVPARANDVPDLSKTGTLTLLFDLPRGLDSYGTVTLVRVGEVASDNGDFYFAPVDALKEGDFDLDDLDNPRLAQSIARLVDRKNLPGITERVSYRNHEASAAFADLELGLYLVVQHRAASGYEKMSPFLISVPYMVDGKYQYKIEADVKSALYREPDPLPPPPKEPDKHLPQTGQLNWPIPILTVCGAALVISGLILRGGKKENHEV